MFISMLYALHIEGIKILRCIAKINPLLGCASEPQQYFLNFLY